MEKAMVKMGSLKAGSFWLSKKAKEELNNITQDLNTVSSVVEEKAKWIFDKLKGKPPRSLPDLLREYNLPAGLFPQNISAEVSFKDSSLVRYAPRVKCILLRGKLMGIEGMKTKVLVWVKVTNVAVEGNKSEKVCFTAGVKKSRPKDAYAVPREAVRVEEF
ncbi:hypothetical protein DH2020_012142 [Rehmannia glutinosa]|uniref:DUF538 family protein n=1 Tax=Rehmannia glutinosa TaxID=99300 RepID=A0ABR0XFB1_REHGL